MAFVWSGIRSATARENEERLASTHVHAAMQQMAGTMDAKTVTEERAEVAPAAPATVMEAIVKLQALAAVYNLAEVILAPHVLYTRHGELHVDAITVERDGRPPKEVKIGTFKLSGLGSLRVSPRRFRPSPLFRSADPKYADVTLLAVEDA